MSEYLGQHPNKECNELYRWNIDDKYTALALAIIAK
jgi:hypothetical protein